MKTFQPTEIEPTEVDPLAIVAKVLAFFISIGIGFWLASLF